MIILASASPRRQELLQQIGCAFQVVVSHAEEEKGQHIDPEELVQGNAHRKAAAVAADEHVVGADAETPPQGTQFHAVGGAKQQRRLLDHIAHLLAQFEDAVLPVALRVKPREGNGKGGVVPAARQPGSLPGYRRECRPSSG